MQRSEHIKTATRLVSRAIVGSALAAMGKPEAIDTMTDDDIAVAVNSNASLRKMSEWASGALSVVLDAACLESIGSVVSTIRQAEGVDTVAVDAALGVEPDPDGDDL